MLGHGCQVEAGNLLDQASAERDRIICFCSAAHAHSPNPAEGAEDKGLVRSAGVYREGSQGFSCFTIGHLGAPFVIEL